MRWILVIAAVLVFHHPLLDLLRGVGQVLLVLVGVPVALVLAGRMMPRD